MMNHPNSGENSTITSSKSKWNLRTKVLNKTKGHISYQKCQNYMRLKQF